jgi:regulator of sirC expression with transglutaminase-like and TPR domain
MSSGPTYECDSEFLKLMTRRAEVDLTNVALELARDAYPDLDFRVSLDWIDARAEELAGPVARAHSERAALEEVSRLIAEKYGILGSTEAYERADGSFLNRIIESQCGIPISLTLLYMAIAERLGIDFKGVSAPAHFIARYESVDGPVFIDAYHHGRIMTSDQCLSWLAELSGQSEELIRPAMRPVEHRMIVIRMLNNLKALYARQQNWAAAWMVQHRLTALQPGAYHERRDLALISLRANRPGHALDLLESCLLVCPDDERETLEHSLRQAKQGVAHWN